MTYYKDITSDYIEGELWADVPKWEGLYQCSSLGRIKSYDRIVVSRGGTRKIPSKILRQMEDKKGYLRVYLSLLNRRINYQVHRLIGITFLQNPDNKPQVNHLFGIKDDNRVSQLGWATGSENELHSYRVLGKKPNKASLGKFGVLHCRSKQINCDTLGMSFGSLNEAARILGVSQGNISGVLSGKRSQTFGLVFRYK